MANKAVSCRVRTTKRSLIAAIPLLCALALAGSNARARPLPQAPANPSSVGQSDVASSPQGPFLEGGSVGSPTPSLDVVATLPQLQPQSPTDAIPSASPAIVVDAPAADTPPATTFAPSAPLPAATPIAGDVRSTYMVVMRGTSGTGASAIGSSLVAGTSSTGMSPGFDSAVANLATLLVRANSARSGALQPSSIARAAVAAQLARADTLADAPPTRADVAAAAAVNMAPVSTTSTQSVTLSAQQPTVVQPGTAAAVVAAADGPNQVVRVYDDLGAVAARMDAATAARIAAHPNVAAVVRDDVVRAAGQVLTQRDTPSWGLTRISQRANTVTDSTDYNYDSTGGAGVTIWIIDSAVAVRHAQFGGRAVEGRSFCTGCAPVPTGAELASTHGSAVAALAASRTFGAAKQARIVSVRALNNDGAGRWSDVIAALQWIRVNVNNPKYRASRGHIVNLSVEGPVNALVNRMIASVQASGIQVVIAAGNSGIDACTTSPASATALTSGVVVVGATTALDEPAYFTNSGTCLDMFAPGDEVISIENQAVSGTSFASPLVAGTMALYMSTNPRVRVRDLKRWVQFRATKGVVAGAEDTSSPNMLLYNALEDAPRPAAPRIRAA